MSVSIPDLPSIPLMKIPDQGTISSRTQQTSFIMNRILEYILKNVTMSDLISLASDEGCKQWIVVAEKKLKVLFKSFDLYPTSIFEKTTDGPIYFARIKDLQDKTSSEPVAKAEKDKYCRVLAFFYIRLFQVVGALALSVQDSSLPLRDLMPEEVAKEQVLVQQKQQIAPFIPIKKTFKERFGFRGGSINYTFMEKYLIDNDNGSYNFSQFPIRTRVQGTTNQFNIKKSPIVGVTVRKGDTAYSFVVERSSGRINITFDFHMENDKVILDNIYKNGNTLQGLVFSDISILDTSTQQLKVGDDSKDFADYIVDSINKIIQSEVSQTVNILKTLNYLKKREEDYIIVDTHIILTINESKEPNPDFLFALETTIDNKKFDIDIEFNMDIEKNASDNKKYTLTIKNLKTKSKKYYVPALKKASVSFKLDRSQLLFDDDSDPELVRNKQTIPRFLESQFKKLADEIIEAVTSAYVKQREGYVRPLANSQSKSQLQYSELWETLQKSPPIKSFCVARALQLLNLSGLSQTTPQSILPLVYKSKFDYIENKSLPAPGKKIVDAAPFKALQQLYVSPKDIPSLGLDKKYLPEDSTKDASLLKILKAFERQNQVLSEIIEDNAEEYPLIKDKQKINILRSHAKQLFQIQFNHTAAVLKLINKLFNVNGPMIEFKQSIAQQGLRGIEIIAIEARDLLSDYYSKCQTEFAAGIDALREKTVTTNPPII